MHDRHVHNRRRSSYWVERCNSQKLANDQVLSSAARGKSSFGSNLNEKVLLEETCQVLRRHVVQDRTRTGENGQAATSGNNTLGSHPNTKDLLDTTCSP